MYHSGGSRSSVSAGVCSTATDAHLALFGPLHYEPNYAYPLVVWLHGSAGDERQLRKVMPLISMRNYVAVGPRGTWAEKSGGFSWRQSHDQVSLAEHRVAEAIEGAKGRYNVNSKRIFLAGFACGGTMAFRLAMRHPEQYAGVISLCGAFPDCDAPLQRIADARQLPIFMSCGQHGVECSPVIVCENLRLFHAAGMSATLRQYPCGDELDTLMLSDLDRWIMSQVVPAAAEPSTSSAL